MSDHSYLLISIHQCQHKIYHLLYNRLGNLHIYKREVKTFFTCNCRENSPGIVFTHNCSKLQNIIFNLCDSGMCDMFFPDFTYRRFSSLEFCQPLCLTRINIINVYIYICNLNIHIYIYIYIIYNIIYNITYDQ